MSYNGGVARVLQENCARCHNPEGGAPFNLLTYADAKQWGTQILEVTQSRYMPPWLPAPDLHAVGAAHVFRGDRRLSDVDLAAIRRWVGAGMPEGAPSPKAGKANSAGGMTGAPPELMLTPAQAIHVPASGPDLFFTFAVPVPAGANHMVRSIGIQASDPQAAHAVLIGVDADRALRTQHAEAAGAGLPGIELPAEWTRRLAPGGQLLLWTPDSPIVTATDSFMVKGGSDLILTVHVKTTGKEEDLSLKVLLFAEKGKRGPAVPRALLSVEHDEGLTIAAGEKQYTMEGQTELKQAATLTTVYPRAHYAATGMEAFATLPDGSQRPLLTIDKWDVDWIGVYRFVKPIALPKGAVLHMRFVYDNSSNNPHNPNDPPKAITAGHGAKDEVGEVWFETAGPVR